LPSLIPHGGGREGIHEGDRVTCIFGQRKKKKLSEYTSHVRGRKKKGGVSKRKGELPQPTF